MFEASDILYGKLAQSYDHAPDKYNRIDTYYLDLSVFYFEDFQGFSGGHSWAAKTNRLPSDWIGKNSKRITDFTGEQQNKFTCIYKCSKLLDELNNCNLELNLYPATFHSIIEQSAAKKATISIEDSKRTAHNVGEADIACIEAVELLTARSKAKCSWFCFDVLGLPNGSKHFIVYADAAKNIFGWVENC